MAAAQQQSIALDQTAATNPSASNANIPRAPAPRAPDVLEQLQKLGEMREKGWLTEKEFQAKKAEILAHPL